MLAMPGMSRELQHLQEGFSSLLQQAEPSVLPAFLLWVDFKVAEFKVNGAALSERKESQASAQQWPKSCHGIPKVSSHTQANKSGGSLDSSQGPRPGDVPMAESALRSALSAQRTPTYQARYMDSASVPQVVPKQEYIHPQASYHRDVPSPRNSLQSLITGIIKRETLMDSPVDMTMRPVVRKAPEAIPSPHKDRPRADSHPRIHHHHDSSIVRSNATLASMLHAAPLDCSRSAKPESIQVDGYYGAKEERPVFIQNAEHNVYAAGIRVPNPLDYSPAKSDCSEKENNCTDLSQKGHVSSALRDLLTTKLSVGDSSQDMEEINGDIIDEQKYSPDGISDAPMEGDSPMERDMLENFKKTNTCSVCNQVFQYRSSFRRHMKVHQGIFSHVCAVCNRKFTRKEHFVRHKCSRKPNKASRGAAGDILSTPGKVPKVEFPPPFSVAGMSSPSSVDTGSMDFHSEASTEASAYPDMFPEYMHSPVKQPGEYRESSASPSGKSSVSSGESRRKKSNPRRAIQVEEEDDPQSLFTSSQLQNGNGLEGEEPGTSPQRMAPEETSPPSPVDEPQDLSSQAHTQVPSPCDSTEYGRTTQGEEYASSDDEDCGTLVIAEDVEDCGEEYCEDGEDMCSEAMDLSQSPQKSDEGMSQEFTIDSGSYKVVTNGENSPGGLSKVIKVIKQGKYLKLKEEAQIIGGQLCFVCPKCGKIFHRSSNFSRHMRIHRGVYSYVCSRCNRGFFRKEHFQKHKCSRRGMAHTWDRKTKVDMVMGGFGGIGEASGHDSSDPGSDAASEESYHMDPDNAPEDLDGDADQVQYDNYQVPIVSATNQEMADSE